ncbi:hypothetical protein BDZ97DRAFT_2058445 [Flammula alnicola]|nr:hypothetical protein BDZ97DRAFT_2058445 [Flammula alnicola]
MANAHAQLVAESQRRQENRAFWERDTALTRREARLPYVGQEGDLPACRIEGQNHTLRDLSAVFTDPATTRRIPGRIYPVAFARLIAQFSGCIVENIDPSLRNGPYIDENFWNAICEEERKYRNALQPQATADNLLRGCYWAIPADIQSLGGEDIKLLTEPNDKAISAWAHFPMTADLAADLGAAYAPNSIAAQIGPNAQNPM